MTATWRINIRVFGDYAGEADIYARIREIGSGKVGALPAESEW